MLGRAQAARLLHRRHLLLASRPFICTWWWIDFVQGGWKAIGEVVVGLSVGLVLRARGRKGLHATA